MASTPGNLEQREEEAKQQEESGLAAADADSQPYSSPQLSRRALEELDELHEAEAAADPENYPLHSPWAFWFERSPKGASTSDFFANLRQICVVKTIKAFWCAFNTLSPVDQLRERESYHLMRDSDRRPVWEDELNAHGGMWSFKISRKDTAAVWQEVLLAAVGEQFLSSMETGDDVCGVSVRIRYEQSVIQIWNLDSELHAKSSVIQSVKELIPTIEINEFYQSNRSKVQDSLRKPTHGHRRFSPPPVPGGHRYPGPPPHFQPPVYNMGPYPPGPPRPYPPFPRYRQPPPPQQQGHRFPRHPYPSP